MKKLYLFLCLIIAAGCSHAQAPAQQPASTVIAPYHILTTDSVYKTPADLKKHKPVMLVFFSPDCSHCQHFMYELKPELDNLKNVQIIMITFVPQLKEIRTFQRDFDLAKYKNIIIGTEGYTYIVQRYYKITNFPFIAIYDKNGKLYKAFDKTPKIPELLDTVKKV